MRCCTALYCIIPVLQTPHQNKIVGFEPIRAKPPDEGPFVPARHRAKSKIAPHGQTMLARAAHLPPESGYFRSAWFSLGNDFRPKNFPRQSWRPAARRHWGARSLVLGAGRPAAPPPPPAPVRASARGTGPRVDALGVGRRSFAWLRAGS